MYISIGPSKVVRREDVVEIFDLDSSTVSLYTRNFLKDADKNKRVFPLGFELPKSFILMIDNTVYLSPYNSYTIYNNKI